MKRKLYFLIKAGLLPVMALFISMTALAVHGPDAGQLPTTPPDNAVGYMDANGAPQVLTSRLVTTLPDGGSVYGFEFRTGANGLNLVRRSTNAAGAYVTETIPVDVDANNWILVHNGEVSCCYSYCETCVLNYNGGACSCDDPNGSCTFDQNHPTRLVTDIVTQ